MEKPKPPDAPMPVWQKNLLFTGMSLSGIAALGSLALTYSLIPETATTFVDKAVNVVGLVGFALIFLPIGAQLFKTE